jgi:hypothetical protein
METRDEPAGYAVELFRTFHVFVQIREGSYQEDNDRGFFGRAEIELPFVPLPWMRLVLDYSEDEYDPDDLLPFGESVCRYPDGTVVTRSPNYSTIKWVAWNHPQRRFEVYLETGTVFEGTSVAQMADLFPGWEFVPFDYRRKTEGQS